MPQGAPGQGRSGSLHAALAAPARHAAPLLARSAARAPGCSPTPPGTAPIDAKTAQRIYCAARDAAGIRPRGRHPHPAALLRHPPARSRRGPAHLQRLLGHGHISTTMRYLHLARSHVTGTTSPLELLDPPTALSGRHGPAAHGVGLAEVLRRHGPAYLATHDLSAAKAKVWRAIVACRTAALGGHVETCDACGDDAPRLSLLPQPALPAVPDARQGSLARRAPARAVAGAVLPSGVHPAARSEWLDRAAIRARSTSCCSARCRPRSPSSPPTRAGWAARRLHAGAAYLEAGSGAACACPCAGGRRGADGRRRVGGGEARLSVSGAGAVEGVPRQVRRRARRRRASAGKLRGAAALDDRPWRELLARLHAHDWVVYAKQPLGGPAQVLEYLGRYTHRVAISNERILGMDERRRCASGCATPPTAIARRTLRLAGGRASSTASCCMCCPAASSASAITACWARRTRRPILAQARAALAVPDTRSGGGGVGGGVHAARRAASSGCAARTAARAHSCRRRRSRRRAPALPLRGGRREAALSDSCRCRLHGVLHRQAGARPLAAMRIGCCLAPSLVRESYRWRRMTRQASPRISLAPSVVHAIRLTSRRARLTIPIATALAAVQSNEVYPPPMTAAPVHVRLRRRINAIR